MLEVSVDGMGFLGNYVWSWIARSVLLRLMPLAKESVAVLKIIHLLCVIPYVSE